MRLTKIYYKRFRVPFVFLTGLAGNFVFLFLFSIFTGASAQDSPDQTIESVEETVALLLEEEKEKEKEKERTVPVSLSYIESSDNSGPIEITYLYDGEMFTFDSSPYDIYWRNGTPYIDVVPKEDDELTNGGV